ncbi:MAG: hypothetical protein KTR22_02670 [Flavobacteriaceae bacterium]|nr:hypothetical protein [Flavobacteriaceae bacterium]
MKKALSLVCIVICMLSLVSCEQEPDELFVSETSDLTTTSSTSKIPTTNACIGNTDLFEAQLQWVSTIAVAVIQDHALAEAEFYNEYNSNGNVIAVDRLIGPNAVYPNFSFDFEQKLYSIIQGNYNPNNSTPPPIPPHIGGLVSNDNPTSFLSGPATHFGGEDETMELVNGFYNTVLTENCIELFLPMGLSDHDTFVYSSHPLDTSDCNEAIQSVKDSNGTWWGTSTSPTVLKERNGIPQNTIIARPVRSGTTPEDPCMYNQYSGIDFTQFLN